MNDRKSNGELLNDVLKEESFARHDADAKSQALRAFKSHHRAVRTGAQHDLAEQIGAAVYADGHAADRAEQVHAFVVASRLMFEDRVRSRGEIVEFVFALRVGRCCRDDFALLVEQVDLHAR